MPSVPENKKAEEIRLRWRQSLTARTIGLPRSAEAMGAMLDSGGFRGTPARKAALISQLCKQLRVNLIKQPSDCDRFAIEVGDSNSNRAFAVANLVLTYATSDLEREAQIGSGVAAMGSYGNVAAIRQKKSELAQERAELRSGASGQPDREVSQRLNAIDGGLDSLEFDHMFAGFNLLANLVGAVSNDSVKTVELTHVEKRADGYLGGVIILAVGCGGIAGASGLLLCALVSTRKKPRPDLLPNLTAQVQEPASTSRSGVPPLPL
jgi:hypothetical protein